MTVAVERPRPQACWKRWHHSDAELRALAAHIDGTTLARMFLRDYWARTFDVINVADEENVHEYLPFVRPLP